MVLIIDHHTFIGPDVEIGMDTVIEPGTYQWKHSLVKIHTLVNIQKLTTVVLAIKFILYNQSSMILVGNKTKVGPFAQLRPGSNLGAEVKVGNFVEVKKQN